jgi:protein-S-isoprenylcysteine O-methyltransferase Ste14
MGHLIGLAYGLAAYLFSFLMILYAIGFTGNLVVPKAIDTGAAGPALEGVIVDLLLLGVFAVQHSVMARHEFKTWWTRIVPRTVERSTYVLCASLALALLYWQWRPFPELVWSVQIGPLRLLIGFVFWVGWATCLLGTFLINHFELFGVEQVVQAVRGKAHAPPSFRTPGLYKLVRHPIYLGLLIAFWAAPDMSYGHLLFALATTGYILIGIVLEERDLVALFGERYTQYRSEVSMLLPLPKRRSDS